MADHVLQKPIRAAVFRDLAAAEDAVHRLEEHGFTDEQITVVCSDPETESHFRAYEHQEPAGYYTGAALARGGIGGAVAGVLICLIVVSIAGGAGMFLTFAALAALTGGALGAFVATMMTRGFERELADFYDQDLERGDILVAAEDHGQQAGPHLDEASAVFSDCGAKPIELYEG